MAPKIAVPIKGGLRRTIHFMQNIVQSISPEQANGGLWIIRNAYIVVPTVRASISCAHFNQMVPIVIVSAATQRAERRPSIHEAPEIKWLVAPGLPPAARLTSTSPKKAQCPLGPPLFGIRPH